MHTCVQLPKLYLQLPGRDVINVAMDQDQTPPDIDESDSMMI